MTAAGPVAEATHKAGYRIAMTTTPQEPAPDPEVVPSGDPNPIPTEPLPEQPTPGEDPDTPRP